MSTSKLCFALLLKGMAHGIVRAHLKPKPMMSLLTFGLQLVVIYLPELQNIFKTAALSPVDLMISLVLSTVVFWGVELEKWFIRRQQA